MKGLFLHWKAPRISACAKMIHQEPNKEQILVVNLSGRGDKDIFTVDKVLKRKRNAIMSRFETKFAELAAKKKGFCTFRYIMRSNI